jgi:hypothetical protein
MKNLRSEDVRCRDLNSGSPEYEAGTGLVTSGVRENDRGDGKTRKKR